MAQYWRDFTDDASATGAPSDFSARGSFISVGVAGSGTEKYLIFGSALGGRVLTWNDVGENLSGTITGTIKIYVDCYQPYSHFDRYYPGAMARYWDDHINHVAQGCKESGSSTAIIQVVSASVTVDTQINRTSGIAYTDKRIHIFMNSIGGDVSVRIEDISGTAFVSGTGVGVENLNYGRMGFYAFDGTSGLRIYGIGVGTAGDDAPTEPVSEASTVTPVKGRIDLVGYAQDHQATKAASPVVGNILFKGYPSTETTTGVATKAPVRGHVDIVGYAIVKQAEKTKLNIKGRIDIVGYAPTTSIPGAVSPEKGRINFKGYAPTVTRHITKSPSRGAITFIGYQIVGTGPITATKLPLKGLLLFHGYPITEVIYDWSAVSAVADTWSGIAAAADTWSAISEATTSWSTIH